MTADDFKAARKALGLTQAEMAEAVGLHRVQIAKIETGKHPVTPTLAKLVTLLVKISNQRG